jgi:hypothetical protein
MSLRFDLEEKMAKSAQEEIESARKADDLKKELDEERAAHQAVKKALVQEQLVNQSLKDELAKITRLKEALEEDLKESLVKNKKAKK